MKNRKWIVISGIFGFTGVALGAFGAHILEARLTSEMIEIYKTGVVYHLIHALTIAAIGLNNDKKYNISLIFFAIGIVLFSFSLYAYAISGIKFLVFVTPIGGISFLFGWLLLIIKGISKSKEETT